MKEGLQNFLTGRATMPSWPSGPGRRAGFKANLFLVGLDENWPNRWYDLQRIFLQAYPRKEGEGLTLESVVDRLGIPKEEPFHNALDDALYNGQGLPQAAAGRGPRDYPTEEELLTEALLGARTRAAT